MDQVNVLKIDFIHINLCVILNIINNIIYILIYQFIRENGGWDNFDREILEYYDCKDEEELKQKEQEYINRFKPTLNTNNAYTSEEVKIEQKEKRDKKYKETEKGRNQD